jgi:hypothetical protein
MNARLAAPLVLLLGCGGGETDDDSTIDPGGPNEQADEIGSESDSSDGSGTSTDESDASTSSSSSDDNPTTDDDPSTSDDDPTTDDDPSTGDTDPTPEFDFGPDHTSEVFAFDDLQLGDLDGDGCADLVLSGTGAPPRFNIYAGACDGTFPGPAITREVFDFDAFVLGDLDADGMADVITQGSGFPPRLEAHLVGPGFTLGAPTTSEVWTFNRLWSIDVDGDARAEVLTHDLEGFPPTVFTWTGPGDGSLDEAASSEVFSFDFAAIGRLDLGERGDLLIGSESLGVQVTRYVGQLDRALVQSGSVQSISNLGRIVLGDLDGDGRDDLLADVPGNDWVVQLYANLGSDFSDSPQLFPGFGYWALRSADLDGDGRDDLIIAPTGAPPRVTTWLSL